MAITQPIDLMVTHFRLLPLWGSYAQSSCDGSHTHLPVSMLPFLSSKAPGGGDAGSHGKRAFSFVQKLPDLCSQWLHPFTFPSPMSKPSSCSIFSSTPDVGNL